MTGAPSRDVDRRDISDSSGKVREDAALLSGNRNFDPVPHPSDRLIATCAKGSRQEFRLTLKKFNGGRKFELRIFEKNALGEFMPTKRRIVLSPAVVRSVIGILEKGEDFALDEGLLPS